MAVIMSNSNELLSLAQRLKEERLYVQSEKHLLQSLHEEVTQISDKLHRVAWITQQQRQTLNSLIRASSNSPPAACCYRANALERVGFIDGYKQLGFQDALYGDVVTYLRENPAIMAQILAQGEKSTIEPVPGLVQTVMSGIYGNCLVEDDEHHFLIFIQALMRYQLAESDDPRRLLRRGRCAFSVAFKLFTEALFSGKLYLTAALHEPVMAVLMNDEVFLETEATKAMDRFTPEERKQRFGTPGTPEYEQNVQKHMNSIMEQLVGLCNEFIVGLHSNIYCFPPSLDWIISQIHKILVDSGQVSPCDVRFMCADLLLNCFIGPAIVDPEPFGITSDILVSETARFNLMQVAQILQGLALQSATSNRDSIGKAPDIYSRFPKGCMSSYLDAVIDNLSSSDTPPTTSQLKGMTRSSTFITETELHGLIGYARAVTAANPDQAIFKELEGLLGSLPASQPQTSQKSSPTLGNPVTPPKPGSTPPLPSPNLSAGFKGNLASKVSNHVAKRIGKTASNASLLGQEEETSEAPSHPECVVVTQPEDVLVIALGNHSNDCPGMLSESKVLSSLPQKAKSREAAQLRVSGNLASISEMPEKHLRFSADASGNSDNMMEAMSIGASNSVYSMDLEAENVSNLSGRNTPRSAISMASSTTEHHRPEIIDSTQLPNNTNITDQFGKFDICTNLQDKKNMGPETFSETWSTDVIGSDTSEPNPNDHLQEIAEEEASLQGATAAFLDVHPVLNDPQETGSETWSVDVLQSDSEQAEDRLHEVEDAQLDMGSVMTEIESEQLLAKVSAEAGSRRSSSGESQSVDRSSSNDSPGVEDCAKRGGGLPMDTSGPKLPGMYPSDELPPIHNLPANQRLKEAAMYRQTAIPPRPTRHPPSSGIGSSFDPLSSDGSQVHSNGFTVTPEKTAKPFSPLEVNSVLQDFDPLATTPSPSANPFTASMNGNVPTVKRSNLPQGAKPKVRPAPSPMQGMPAGGGKYNDNLGSFNPLYDIHSDGYSASPQKPDGLFDMAPSSSQFAIINHGFSDQPMNGQQNSNYLPGYSNPMANFEPPQPGGLHPSPFVPQKTQGLPFPARNSLGGSDSGVMSGESGTSSDHFSNRADSSISTASSGSASLLMVSSDSFKPLESSQMSSGEWSLLDSPASHSANFLSSPSSSTGAVVGSSEESDSKLGSTPSFDRSISSDSFETEAGLESPDKGKSWFKKKFKQINKSIARSKSQKEKSSSVREDAMWPQQVSQQGPAKDIKGSSDSLQIIPNPALVSEPFDADDGVKGMSVPETSGEDILNKYRDLGKGRPVDPLEANDDSITDGINADSSVDEDSGSHGDKPDSNSTEPSSSADSDSLESTYAFNDAKRKLRIVLRSADFHNLPSLVDFTSHYRPSEGLGELQSCVDGREMSRHPENELVAFLKVQLAEAMNLQDKALIAQLRETLRCVGNFDNEGCRKLLAVLREDYESRAPYVAYLVRSRKGLALSKAHLERMLERIQRDKEVVNKFFTMVCVRFFLGRQETSIIKFINDFKALTAADEKTHLVKYFLATLNSWIQQDPIWQAASDTQKQDAEVATERAIMSRIYKLALYPNGDGDILRDQVLQQHIHRLAKVVTASHKALLIPEKYRRESPWPAAQAEILNINAYKTPKDKVQCVLRCCTIIMNLLSMADSAAPPGADDFVPVLMFVLIKANPPSLLSTVQYVNSFYYESDPYSDGEGSSGSGEERYWWMQFSAAVEYLKTIDDRK